MRLRSIARQVKAEKRAKMEMEVATWRRAVALCARLEIEHKRIIECLGNLVHSLTLGLGLQGKE